MMFSTEDAVSDEPVAGAFPTDAELGRQIKRLKTSQNLNMCTETCLTVTDGVIGARFAKATSMAFDMAMNNAGGVAGNPDRINAIGIAVNRACAPQGAISDAIERAVERACAPQGAISDAVERAFERASAPGGSISNAIGRACAPSGAVHRALNSAMRTN